MVANNLLSLSLFDRESCWLCDAMFVSWPALKKHLISPAHVRMTVICPWCMGKEKTFTRIADLKQHVIKIHKTVGAKDSFFSRGIGFYFAKYPSDYFKIVDYVTPYHDDSAIQARSLVRKWAETRPNSIELMEHLNTGWKEVKRHNDTGNNEYQRDNSQEQSVGKAQRKVVGQGKDDSGTKDKKGHKRKKTGYSKGEIVDNRGDNRSKNSIKEKAVVNTRESERTQCAEKNWSEDDDKTDRETDMSESDEDQGNNRNAELDIDGVSSKSKKTRRSHEEEVEEEGVSNYKDDTVLGESESSFDSDIETDDERSINSKASVGCGREEELRARATKILMRGAMPMCPPAQRDWSQVTEFTVEGKTGSLVWPPKNWMSLNPDQKLLAHEYAAIFLEQGRGNGFPLDLSRRVILDKYNFLALEGAARPRAESAKHKADSKIRYYTYEFVRNVVKGSVGDSRISQGLIASLEMADRWTDTDFFTDNLDAVNVQLRV